MKARCACLLVLVSVSGVASADLIPIVDGVISQTEGYTETYDILVTLHKKDNPDITIDPGKLYLHQDPATKDLYFGIVLPKSLVDNTTGANSIGWDNEKDGKHKFDSLVGSDKALLSFYDTEEIFPEGATPVFSFKMDYITKTSKRGEPLEYDSLGVLGGDGGVLVGSSASLLEWGTSLDYNINTKGYELFVDSPATDASYTPNPSYPDWEFAVIFEGRVDGDIFSTPGQYGVSVDGFHFSPNKFKGYKSELLLTPEPMSMLLMGTGCAAGMLGWRRRRRNNKA